MKKINPKKPITLEHLAQMVARGFENTASKDDFNDMSRRLEIMEEKLQSLIVTVQTVVEKLAHYIDLHEGRYLDLKNRYKHLARWAEKVASKTGVPLPFEVSQDL